MPELSETDRAKFAQVKPADRRRFLRQRGYDDEQIGALLASDAGLPISSDELPINWTADEVARLGFVRYRHASGRLRP
jgi:hypothetical protein